MRMCSWFLLTGYCLEEKNKAPFNYKYKLSPTLSIYKIVIRLTSQVLSKENSRLVADRQKCNQILLLELRALGTLDRHAHHLSYQGGQNSPPHTCIFLVFSNLDCFDLGTSLSEKAMF